MNFEKICRSMLESLDFKNRTIYVVDIYTQHTDTDIQSYVQKIRQIDPQDLTEDHPWAAEVTNDWDYYVEEYHTYEQAAIGLQTFMKDLIKRENEHRLMYDDKPGYDHMPRKPVSFSSEALTNAVLQQFQHLKHLPGKWKIVTFEEHDIQLFGFEADVVKIRNDELINTLNTTEIDSDLSQLF